jgi:hypothetical protein
LKLLALGLQYRGSKQRHLLALLYTAQDLGVVEITDSDAEYPRRERVALLDEREQRATRPTGATSSTNCPGGAAARAATAGTATTKAPTGRRCRTLRPGPTRC